MTQSLPLEKVRTSPFRIPSGYTTKVCLTVRGTVVESYQPSLHPRDGTRFTNLNSCGVIKRNAVGHADPLLSGGSTITMRTTVSTHAAFFGLTESKATYFGKPFGLPAVQQAVHRLAASGLIPTGTGEDSISVTRPYLTHDGLTCAEQFDSDVRQYDKVMNTPPINQHWTVNNSGQMQLSTGSNANLTMNVESVGTHVQELIYALDGLVQLVRSVGEDDNLESLYQEAVEEITSPTPTGTALTRTLARAKDLSRQAGNTTLAALVTVAANGLLADAARVLGIH